MGEVNRQPKIDSSLSRPSSPTPNGLSSRVLATSPPPLPPPKNVRIKTRILNSRPSDSSSRFLARNLPRSAVPDNELKRQSIQDANAILAGGSLLPNKTSGRPWQQSWLFSRDERSSHGRPTPLTGSTSFRSTLGSRHSPQPSLESNANCWALPEQRDPANQEVIAAASANRKPGVKFSLDALTDPQNSRNRLHAEFRLPPPSLTEPEVSTVEAASRRTPLLTNNELVFSLSTLLGSRSNSESQFSLTRADGSTTLKLPQARKPSVLDRGRRKSPRSPSPSAHLSRTPSQSSFSPRHDSFLLSPIPDQSPESQTTCDPGDTPRGENDRNQSYSVSSKLSSLATKPGSWFSKSFSHRERQILLDVCRTESSVPLMDQASDEKQLVRIFVRLRGSCAASPTSETSSAVSYRTLASPTSNDCVVWVDDPCNRPDSVDVHYRSLRMPASLAPGESEYFQMSFSEVLGSEAQQADVFDTIARPYLDDTISRFRHGLIMAYGQTGTGKTYTLEGHLPIESRRPHISVQRGVSIPRANHTSPPEDVGIIPRTLWWVFNEALSAQMKEAYRPYFPTIPDNATLGQLLDIKMSVLEIYMEQPRDLLTGSDRVKLRETANGDLFWESLSEEVVNSYEAAIACFSRARQYRRIGETMVNRRSSRSHVIVTLVLRLKSLPLKCRIDTPTMKLHLLDLAGNEKLSKSQVTGTGLQELKKINHSLSTLALVMQTLSKYYSTKVTSCSKNAGGSTSRELITPSDRNETHSGSSHLRNQHRAAVVKVNPHVPYRNSLLTRALQQSLSGENPIILICTVSVHRKDYLESLATLRFAQQCQNIAVMPKHPAHSDPAERADSGLRQCVAKLVATLLRMEKMNDSLKKKMRSCKTCHRLIEADPY